MSFALHDVRALSTIDPLERDIMPDQSDDTADVVAAVLTCAAHLHILSTQLQGRTSSVEEAVRTVRETWRALRNENGAPRYTPNHESPAPQTFPGTMPVPPSDSSIGPFTILEPRGHGGSGRTYLASDESTGENVWLEVIRHLPQEKIHEAMRALGSPGSPFLAIDHRNVARLYAAGVADGALYLATELVDGPSLRDWLGEKDTVSVLEGQLILRDVIAGAAAIHAAGVVHGNLNPRSIALAPATEIVWKITDLALSSVDLTDDRDLHVTAAGAPVGDLAYSSPESLSEESLTAASNVYSIGVIAYQIFSGANPFDSPSPYKCLENQLTMTPPPLVTVRSDISQAMSSLVDRCLAKDPSERFASAVELESAFRSLG